jgi:pSer/pThr/pTyr-binding forkhead associated (FHA) protein
MVDMPLVVQQQPAPLDPAISAPQAPQAPAPQPQAQPQQQPAGVSAGRVQMPSGERIDIANSVISIGRLPECTITLNDPNVSRRHAEIRPGNAIVIADLGSTNGTKVNGLRIDGERVLTDGDIISLGSTHLRFEAMNSSA